MFLKMRRTWYITVIVVIGSSDKEFFIVGFFRDGSKLMMKRIKYMKNVNTNPIFMSKPRGRLSSSSSLTRSRHPLCNTVCTAFPDCPAWTAWARRTSCTIECWMRSRRLCTSQTTSFGRRRRSCEAECTGREPAHRHGIYPLAFSFLSLCFFPIYSILKKKFWESKN